MARSIAVIGGGIAGQAVIEELREGDPGAELTLICGEPVPPYDRVRLSELLESDMGVDSLQLRPDGWYGDNNVELLLSTWVEQLDAESRELTIDGQTRTFDAICVATGSDALVPPIPGADLPGVFVYRGPEDCAAIRAGATAGKPAAVIGGGLLGLEAAKGLAALGSEVTVVHLMDRLMERQLDQGSGAMLLEEIRKLGADVLLERSTAQIAGNGRVNSLRFADGKELGCELVVISVGIKPQVELAKSAGLDCERGVVVDDRMQTSAQGVYAVGECAQHRGLVYGIVAPIYDQAKVAAAAILARPDAPYEGSLMSAKLKVMGIDLVSIGDPSGDQEAVVSDDAQGVYRKLVLRDGKLAGAILMGDTRGYEFLLEEAKQGRDVDDMIGLLADASAATAADLPDEAQVCNCNGVCKGQIVSAVNDDGLRSTQEVVAVTRAGAGCGSCKPLVAEIIALTTGGVDEPAYLCPCKKLTRDQVAKTIRDDELISVSELGDACGAGHDCGACKPGLSYLVSEINDNRHREERAARFINDRVHANIQNDGTFSVVPRIYGGVTSPAELKKIAEVAEKYAVPTVKITGGQRIDLLGVKKEDLPKIWDELGMPSGHAYAKAVRTVKTCVGTDHCRFGLGDAIALGIEVEKEWEGIHTPHKVKAAVSGCPRNCAEASTKDIGIIAVEGGWQLRIGGAAGARVREGDIIATVETKAEAMCLSTTFLQYYREHGEYLERTYDFVERVGLQTIKDAVLDENSNGPARLRERFKLAKSATLDPWLERREPVHPRQFRELAPVGPPPSGLHGEIITTEG